MRAFLPGRFAVASHGHRHVVIRAGRVAMPFVRPANDPSHFAGPFAASRGCLPSVVQAAASPDARHVATSASKITTNHGIHEPIDEATNHDSSTRAIRLAWEVLRPDWPLVALTAGMLVASILTTLAFPLAIGDLFDVVRTHLQENSIAVAEGGSRNLAQMIRDVRMAAASAPPAFGSVLARLCACLVASATGNGIVAYLAPMLGERFGTRMRERLMMVRERRGGSLNVPVDVVGDGTVHCVTSCFVGYDDESGPFLVGIPSILILDT
jgi:hypothetical protein